MNIRQRMYDMRKNLIANLYEEYYQLQAERSEYGIPFASDKMIILMDRIANNERANKKLEPYLN